MEHSSGFRSYATDVWCMKNLCECEFYADNVAISKCHVKRFKWEIKPTQFSIQPGYVRSTLTQFQLHWSITKPSLLVIMLLKWPNHHYAHTTYRIEKCVMAKWKQWEKNNLIECTLHSAQCISQICVTNNKETCYGQPNKTKANKLETKQTTWLRDKQ